MSSPTPGAQISEDGHYWWNENTGDPNEPQRWEPMDPAASAQAAQPAQSTDPAANQSDESDVTIDFEYATTEDSGVSLDELIASGWEPESEDENVS